jgi:hypothetical protein
MEIVRLSDREKAQINIQHLRQKLPLSNIVTAIVV